MDLLKGVGVVIDDGIGEQDNINKIISKVHDKGIPTTEFKSIESAEKCMRNFIAVNFIILDWKMESISTESPIGVRVGQELVADTKQKVIGFIKELKKYCFAPIFIFTNEAQSDIESDILAKLRSAELYFDQEGRDYICVRNKNDMLQNDKLFTEIDQWIHKTPSIYVLKIWDKNLHKAKSELFWDLYNKSNGCWPKVLWEHYEQEKEVPHTSINEMIFQIISSKVTLKELDKQKVITFGKEPELPEIKEIFRRVMFQEGELEGIKPGDIFKDGDKYYLNIRPECDTIEGRAGDCMIYLIEGKKTDSSILQKLREQYSNGLNPKINEAFIWLIEGDGIVKFSFREVKPIKYSEMKDKRICRLLPPYITNIQQRFSSYLGRFAVPRLPKKIEEDILKVS